MNQEIERVTSRPETLRAFCRKWNVGECCLFGSVLRDDFGASSDIDVLAQFEPDHTSGLMGIARMECEMAEMFGRNIDLVTRNAIEKSRNPIRRRTILESERVLFVVL